MPLPNLHLRRHIARSSAAAAVGGLLLCAAFSAAALPEGITTADIALWYGGPSYNRSVTGRSFVIVPSQAGAGAIGQNGALARVQFVGPTGGTGPGLGLVPGQPGAVLVELGIQATLVQGHPLTVSGNPGFDLLAPMWRDIASASALYRDQITFSDASLPPGAPLTVSLSYYLSSDKCRGAGACALQPPPGFDPKLAPFGRSRAVVEVASSVSLPTGVDRQASVRTDSSPGLGGGIVPGLGGNTLTHTFTVANGATHDFGLSLIGTVVFDGLDYVDANGFASVGNVQTYFDLDYFGTLHIGAIEATDAQGQALPGFAITNSLGWTMATTPPVPEPATSGLMLIGLTALGWTLRRRWRLQPLLIVLACAAGAAQAQQLRVEGFACASECDSYTQASSANALSDLALQGFGGGAAQSAAHANFGVLRLLAISTGLAASQATTSFSDRLTVLPANPLRVGEFGLLEWRMALSGTGDLQINAVDGYGSVSIDTFAPGAALGTGRTLSLWFNDIGGPVQFDGDPLPRHVVVRQGFIFGEPFEIGFQLNATTGAAGASALADLMNTATWGGITAVSVAGVAFRADEFHLQSASGTDYRGAITPVPELPQALLLLLGLGALGLRRHGWAAQSQSRGHRTYGREPGIGSNPIWAVWLPIPTRCRPA